MAITYDIPLAISLGAFAVATVAAISNLLSLKWSRDAVRPFLYYLSDSVDLDRTKDYVKLAFKIFNSGSLPATNINVDIDFFGKDEEIKGNNTSKIYSVATKEPITPMILPNDYFTEQYIFNLKDINDVKMLQDVEQGKTKIRMRISYSSLDREHLTVETFSLSKPEWETKLQFIPIEPQSWK